MVSLCVVLFLLLAKHLDLATLLIRYIIRVRKVKGGGSRESGSKNCIARYSRAYLKQRNSDDECQKIEISVSWDNNSLFLLPLGIQIVVDLLVSYRHHHDKNPEEDHADQKLVDDPHGNLGYDVNVTSFTVLLLADKK